MLVTHAQTVSIHDFTFGCLFLNMLILTFLMNRIGINASTERTNQAFLLLLLHVTKDIDCGALPYLPVADQLSVNYL